MSNQRVGRFATTVPAGNGAQASRIRIPDEVCFVDLDVTRLPNGAVAFDLDVVERIFQANDLDARAFDPNSAEGESNLCMFLLGWYEAALASGEPHDPVMEDLFAEVLAEERVGQNVSLAPGRA